MHLLRYFHQLSIHPENANKLRGLILQLAIEGKLTAEWRTQNPGAEPSSELLKQIREEKAQLIKKKKIRKEKPLPPITKEERLSGYPNSWTITRLGEIGDWGAGATPLRSNAAYYGGSINWFKSGELNNGLMDYDSTEKITDVALKETSLRMNEPGDVLIAMYGATIGKTGILAVSGTTNQAVCACTCFAGVYNHFLHLLLKALKPSFINQGEGGAQPNISRVKIRNTAFALPPLPEQHAIVQIVNTLLQEVDQLEQLTAQRLQLKEDYAASALHQLVTAPAPDAWAALKPHFHTFFNEAPNIQKLREAILQLAVQGKLTAAWRRDHPDVEPAGVLLERIREEKARLIKEKKIRKEKALPGIKAGEAPFEVPEGWVWCRFGEAIQFMAYGTSQKTNNDDSNVPVLRMGNITSEGELIFDNLKYIPPDHKDLPKLYLNYGDLVFNRTNSYELVGKSGVFKGKDFEYTLASYLIKVTPFKEYVNSDYLNSYIISPICRKTQIEPEITAQTNQANFSGSKLKNILLPLPPLEEQNVIVEKIKELTEYCIALKTQISARQLISDQLLQSALKEVFDHPKPA